MPKMPFQNSVVQNKYRSNVVKIKKNYVVRIKKNYVVRMKKKNNYYQFFLYYSTLSILPVFALQP